MKRSQKSSQRGISFLGLLIMGIVLAAIGAVAAQVFPTVVEYQAVLKAANRAKEGNTVAEVRGLFEKSTEVDDIHSITAKDIDISKDGDKVIVSFAYNKEIHLAGPAYLLIKYTGQSK